MKRLVLVLLLAGWTAALAFPSSSRPKNLVTNGAFQKIDPAGSGSPAGWSTAGSPAVEQRLDAGTGRDGSRCARLSCSAFPASEFPAVLGAADHAMVQQAGVIAVQGGRWYRISFWAKASFLTARVVSLALEDTE